MEPIGVARVEPVVGEGENCEVEAVVGKRMGKFNDNPFACRLAEAAVLFVSRSGLAGTDGAASEVVDELETGSSCNEIGRDLVVMVLERG